MDNNTKLKIYLFKNYYCNKHSIKKLYKENPTTF